MATLPADEPSSRKATIEDVARRADVGTTTVSRVMNGSPLVAPETRERVMAAVAELGYTPNLHARKFRTGRTRTVSVILPMPGTDFYGRLLEGVEFEFGAAGYDLALFPLLSPERLERYFSPTALPYQADAVLFASLDPSRLYPQGRAPTDLPAVLVDVVNPRYPSFAVDNRLGGRLAAECVLDRPAPTFVVQVEERMDTPFGSGVFGERLSGFRERLEEGGEHLPDENVRVVEFSWGGGRVAMRDILSKAKPPVNVFASCDLMAIGVLDEVLHAGLEVGTDVRVVGFDDIPWAAERGLTTVRQPIEEMGRAAAREVLERIANPTPPPQVHRFTPTLQARESA